MPLGGAGAKQAPGEYPGRTWPCRCPQLARSYLKPGSEPRPSKRCVNTLLAACFRRFRAWVPTRPAASRYAQERSERPQARFSLKWKDKVTTAAAERHLNLAMSFSARNKAPHSRAVAKSRVRLIKPRPDAWSLTPEPCFSWTSGVRDQASGVRAGVPIPL